MNEEALKYSYDIFKKDGYNGSIEDYNTLMSSNEEALEYSYNLFKDDGYNGEIDDFNSLLGISTQKKIQSKRKNLWNHLWKKFLWMLWRRLVLGKSHLRRKVLKN